jgi:hypothetical protein
VIEIEKTIKETRRKRGKNYGDLVRCIIFHRKILEYLRFESSRVRGNFLITIDNSFISDIESIFRDAIFVQLMFSSLIICMTLLLMANSDNFGDLVGHSSYLMAMVIQIFLCCWAGNEIESMVRYYTWKFIPKIMAFLITSQMNWWSLLIALISQLSIEQLWRLSELSWYTCRSLLKLNVEMYSKSTFLYRFSWA